MILKKIVPFSKVSIMNVTDYRGLNYFVFHQMLTNQGRRVYLTSHMCLNNISGLKQNWC